MANKELDLFKELIPAIDMGIKELYDAAGEDGKKDIKLDLWNLNRYISSVKGNYEKTALAVFKTNEYYNKNWNVLGGTNHVKLRRWSLYIPPSRLDVCRQRRYQGFFGHHMDYLNPSFKKGRQLRLYKRISSII